VSATGFAVLYSDFLTPKQALNVAVTTVITSLSFRDAQVTLAQRIGFRTANRIEQGKLACSAQSDCGQVPMTKYFLDTERGPSTMSAKKASAKFTKATDIPSAEQIGEGSGGSDQTMVRPS
jgi:hypothetical protein